MTRTNKVKLFFMSNENAMILKATHHQSITQFQFVFNLYTVIPQGIHWLNKSKKTTNIRTAKKKI